MNTRAITETDYNMFTEWWKFFRFPAPPTDILPNNGMGGIVVQKGDVDICAGFLYLTNSKIAWIEYIVSNPDYRKEDRKEAIRHLISELCLIGKEQGYRIFYTSVANENLINRFKEVGFHAGSKATELTITL